MSHLLWKYYIDHDVDRFRALLANASHAPQHPSKNHGPGPVHTSNLGSSVGSPGTAHGTSPRMIGKGRKSSAHLATPANSKMQQLSRAEVNSRDSMGLTVLHRAVSANAIDFALLLIQHPAIDLYIQDLESGWTVLHRALYFGNTMLARAILQRDLGDTKGHGAAVLRAGSLIKVKDHEGNSPFDVYNATIARRTLQQHQPVRPDNDSDEDDASVYNEGLVVSDQAAGQNTIDGDEVFAFGSNKNFNLGFGDQDDRQYPEKIVLKRPDHLIQRFHREKLLARAASGEDVSQSSGYTSIDDIPSLTRNLPIKIQDVALSKLHSAILTTDPESNLYMCGYGQGGRLGTGDEQTRFNYVCIEGGALSGKKIGAVALGQNHTLCISDDGEIFSWGTNTWGQLGYTLPRPPLKDEEPVNSVPRQIFGGLKSETIVGIAASAIHSVAHTSTSLYTWGKNEGQLGLMDSDSRSLEAQTTPRKVAASQFTSSIVMVSAINRATVCLLANHTVRVFTNYGYKVIKFPLQEGFSNYFLRGPTTTTRYDAEPTHISSITSGGETIAALSSRGDLFTVNVSQKLDPSPAATSTTNPAKIREALSQPVKVWSLRKGNWDGVKSVAVGENGSVIICTQAGAVWRRVKRPKVGDYIASEAGDYRKKDYKFQRIPGLTKVTAVRSNVWGSYVAVRKDCDVTKTQVLVDESTIWDDILPLLSLQGLEPGNHIKSRHPVDSLFSGTNPVDVIRKAFLVSADLEGAVALHMQNVSRREGRNAIVYTTISDVGIPVHAFALAGRSPVLRHALSEHRKHGHFTISEVLTVSWEDEGVIKITLNGVDFLTLVNIVLYAYTDTVMDVWQYTRHIPDSAFRYRQVRTELMKIATKLGMNKLEDAVRLMGCPERRLNVDLGLAIKDSSFFEDADTIVELDGGEMPVHSALMCQRCPFFDGLFNGRAGGQWLASRWQSNEPIRVDLKHVAPDTFELVLRHIYADVGTELFDDIVSEDIDEFSELVMDVMSVADELMLDRLSQICQHILGRFVNMRNVCPLLNAISPFSVSTFKDAGLEYLCLQLEAMLENRLLDELEDDLMLELDEVVRENQLACLPIAKSGRSEQVLLERYPHLAEDIDEERQRRVRDMAFRARLQDEDSKMSSSYRARIGSLEDSATLRAHIGSPDDILSSSPSRDKLDRRAARQNTPFSPVIRPKDSGTDLMFDMEEDSLAAKSPTLRPFDPPTPPGKSVAKPVWGFTKGKAVESPLPAASTSAFPSLGSQPQPKPKPAKSRPIPSAPPASFSPAPQSSSPFTLVQPKIRPAATAKSNSSPAVSLLTFPPIEPRAASAASNGNATPATKTPVGGKKPVTGPKPPRGNTKSSLTMSLQDFHQKAAKEDTPPLTKNLSWAKAQPTVQASPFSISSSTVKGPGSKAPLSAPERKVTPPSGSARETEKSKEDMPSQARAGAPKFQKVDMRDIMAQQTEDIVRIEEAKAVRSLQEIQEEQAFEEWWDQESRRAQEMERRASAGAPTGVGSSRGAGRGGRRRGRGRGGAKGERGRS